MQRKYKLTVYERNSNRKLNSKGQIRNSLCEGKTLPLLTGDSANKKWALETVGVDGSK